MHQFVKARTAIHLFQKYRQQFEQFTFEINFLYAMAMDKRYYHTKAMMKNRAKGVLAQAALMEDTLTQITNTDVTIVELDVDHHLRCMVGWQQFLHGCVKATS